MLIPVIIPLMCPENSEVVPFPIRTPVTAWDTPIPTDSFRLEVLENPVVLRPILWSAQVVNNTNLQSVGPCSRVLSPEEICVGLIGLFVVIVVLDFQRCVVKGL